MTLSLNCRSFVLTLSLEKKHTPITARQNEKEKEKKNVRSARGGRGGSRGRGSRGPKRDHDRRSGTGHGYVCVERHVKYWYINALLI